jgi:putative transposase
MWRPGPRRATGRCRRSGVNSRNGCRAREWDIRAGRWSLRSCGCGRAATSRRSWSTGGWRSGRWASAVATSYLLGVSTRRVWKLPASLNAAGLSKSQVSAVVAELDELVAGFRVRAAGRVQRCWRDLMRVIDLRPACHPRKNGIRVQFMLGWLALLLIRIAETTCVQS